MGVGSAVKSIVKVDGACGLADADETGLFRLGTAGAKLIVSGTGLGVGGMVEVGVSVRVKVRVGVGVSIGEGVRVGVGFGCDVGSPWPEDDESHPAITAAKTRAAQPTRNRAGVSHTVGKNA
jgi:hypothetical protein